MTVLFTTKKSLEHPINLSTLVDNSIKNKLYLASRYTHGVIAKQIYIELSSQLTLAPAGILSLALSK